MLYEDQYGILLNSDEIDELSAYEIEERKIHVYSELGMY